MTQRDGIKNNKNIVKKLTVTTSAVQSEKSVLLDSRFNAATFAKARPINSSRRMFKQPTLIARKTTSIIKSRRNYTFIHIHCKSVESYTKRITSYKFIYDYFYEVRLCTSMAEKKSVYYDSYTEFRFPSSRHLIMTRFLPLFPLEKYNPISSYPAPFIRSTWKLRTRLPKYRA